MKQINPLWAILLLVIIPLIGKAQSRAERGLMHATHSVEAMNNWVDSTFQTLSLEEQVGQLFVIDASLYNSPANRKLLRRYVEEYHVGGVLFGSGTVMQQAIQTNYAQSLAEVPLLITLDGEWGLAMRLTDAPKFPKNITLGAIRDNRLLYLYGKEVGRECRRLGIHVNFSPVVDVNSNPRNPVIGYRSFGENPQEVSRKAIAYAKGLQSEGVLSVAKHFPGHGDTSEDSHITLPLLNKSRAELEACELYPFREYIEAGLSSIMVGHLQVPAFEIDAKRPSTLSPAIVDTLLQQQMGFDGLIFTDALDMRGVGSRNVGVEALLAGNDILLKPLTPIPMWESVLRAVQQGEIPQELIAQKCRKILRYKYLLGLNRYQPIPLKGLMEELNTPYTQKLQHQLYANAITVAHNQAEILPFTNLLSHAFAVVSLGVSDTLPTPFEEGLNRYTGITSYRLPSHPTKTQLEQTSQAVTACNTLIVAVHGVDDAFGAWIAAQAKHHRVILVSFISPYQLTLLGDSLAQVQAVVMGYEDALLAQDYAAQSLFGGIDTRGSLPLSLSSRDERGKGITTYATRLGYGVPEEVGMSTQTLQRIDGVVKRAMEKRAFPGCQILVARGGVVIYNRNFGAFDYAGTHPVEGGDLYDLASVTKAAATLPAVMRLVGEQKLSLTAPLSQYIPSLRGGDKAEITLREALFHESGMPPVINMYGLLLDADSYKSPLFKRQRNADYRIEVERNLYAHQGAQLRTSLLSTTPREGFTHPVAKGLYMNDALPDTIFERIAHTPLRSTKEYLYSCLNFALLQRAVEEMSHSSLNSYVSRHLFAPLGANNLTYKPLEKFSPTRIAPTENEPLLRKQILVGYPHDELAAFEGGVGGNAGLFGNANDLAKLLQMYLNEGSYGGEALLDAATVRQFTSEKSSRSRRGLGFDKPLLERPEAGPTCPEASPQTYGHTGYTGCAFWIDPTEELIYIFLTNRIYPHRWNSELTRLNVRTDIQSILYEAIEAPV